LKKEGLASLGAIAGTFARIRADVLARPGWLRAALIVAVVLVALVLRGRAVQLLTVDYDEDNYLRAGQQYRAALLSGDWHDVMSRTELSEHPVVGKVIYGAVLTALPPGPEIPERRLSAPPDNNLPQPQLTAARLTATTFGVLAVAALALLDPIAGALLAISSWSVKYTTEVMLESFGAFFSLLTILAYVRAREHGGRWLAVSAICLGLTAATKYVYAVVGIAITIDWLLSWRAARKRSSGARAPDDGSIRAPEERPIRARDDGSIRAPEERSVRGLLAWGILAVAVFLAADFYLWPDPIGRLAASIAFHESYALGGSVRTAGLPPWQPVVWLSQSVPWQTDVFLVRADVLIVLLGLVGLPLAWRRHRVVALWLLVGLAFLFVWPTKWPQYTTVVTAPLAVAAAAGIRSLWNALRAHLPRVYQIAPGES
jgi:small basic protein